MTVFMVLFLLLVGHAICDYPLQGDAVAINKNPNANTPLQKHVPWYYWLLSHALMHGGAVALITGSVVLGVLETIAHFFIDYHKCVGRYNIHIDQLLHIICKFLWLVSWIVFVK
jgi:hypothetical protein